MAHVAPDIDVVVIGAGLAGLGAAHRLRELGMHAVVLEAAGRIGGRAWTDHPPALGGAWFDMCAVWLHAAEQNPLAAIARSAGEALIDADELRQERTFVGSRPATPPELIDYTHAWPRFEASAERLLHAMPDTSLDHVARHLPDDPWALTVESWEGPVICTADAGRLSLRDWRRNGLSGANLMIEGGIGSFVQRRLGEGLTIRLGTPVTRIRWAGSDGGVAVETADGTIAAGACIVTVSTGVLAAGAIDFDPALPAAVQDSVHALPMGLAMKVALRATLADRLDLPAHCTVDRQIARSLEPMMVFQCWPFGRDFVQGWVGGTTAWELAREGDAAAADFALAELRRLFGGRVDRLFAGGGSVVTHWESDPWVRGAYSYAIPGHADARRQLAAPLADGRLCFAGEACHDGFAGTLAGAWISGRDAGAAASRALHG